MNNPVTPSVHPLNNPVEKLSQTSMTPGIIPNPYLFSHRKRLLDITFTLLILPFLLPVLVLSALLVLFSMGLPLIFRQKRVGMNGQVFTILKLRSLKRESNNHSGVTHKQNDVTHVGKLLRLFRLDELPQIWNILKGEMSWVGPRPEVPLYVEKYTSLDPHFSDRLLALPGITGLAQLNNPNATPNDNLDKLKYDVAYIQKANLRLDIQIILRTFFLPWK